MADELRAALRKRLARFGQEHVLRFWGRLNDASRRKLAGQVESLDLELVDRLVKTHVRAKKPVCPERFSPVEVTRLPRTERERAAFERARKVGQRLLAEGRAACVVVAGGQGTRLGYDHPKGKFPVAPVSGKSIFQLHVERLRALSRRLKTHIPLFVMTGDTTDAETREFFRENGNFGLPEDDLFLFRQDMVPAVSFAGKLILDAPDHVFENPNGHGGVLPALVKSGGIDRMRRRGVTDIFHFQVDNVLADVADPVFLGFHHLTGSGMSSKVCRKRDAFEPVGVTVKRADGHAAVVEYINLPADQAQRREKDGSLTFWAANLCIFWYSVDLAERAGTGGRLPWNLARKKVPSVRTDGTPFEPARKNGIKFETFVFDAFPLARKTFLMEIDRAEEFAPVKKKTGEDSVESARNAMTGKFARWLEACGVTVPRRGDGLSTYPIEISALYASDAGELKRKLPKRFRVDGPVLLE